MIFCHSGSLGCDSALSGSSPQLCIPGFHRGRILTPLGSVFSGSATGFSQLRRFTSQVHKLCMQGMAGNAKPSSDTENVQGNGKNLLCAFGAPVNSLLWLPQTSVKVLIDLFFPMGAGPACCGATAAPGRVSEGSELSCT